MSTAGKVLTVLILLVMVAWIVMISAVAQLNMNYGAKVDAQAKTLETLQKDVDQATTDVAALTEKARVEQVDEARDLRALQQRIAAVEASLSRALNRQTQIAIELADTEVAVKNAVTNLENRNAEEAKAKEDLARKMDEIEKSKGVNGDLKGQLAKLQDEFKALLAENASRVQQELKSRPARNASERRVPPAS
jgi:chromosome segregation ATPase